MRKIVKFSLLLCGLLLSTSFHALTAQEKKPSIKIITISTPNRTAFTQYAIPALKNYTDTWGYTLKMYDQTADPSRNIAWSRIKLLKEAIEQDEPYDWLAWIDDDIFITNPKISLESYIQANPNAHFIIGADTTSPTLNPRYIHVNGGFFLIKKSSWSQSFLQEVWDIGDHESFRHAWPCEQGVISELLLTKYAHAPEVARLDTRSLQAFMMLLKKGETYFDGQWQPGDLMAHMAGEINEARELYMQQLNANPRILPTLPGFWKEKYSLKRCDTEAPLSIAIITKDPTKNMKDFADFWGYQVASYDKKINVDIEKLKIIAAFLDSFSGDWALWLENQAEPIPRLPIELFIQENEPADLIAVALTDTSGNPIILNSNFFLVKNSDWAKKLLADVINKEEQTNSLLPELIKKQPYVKLLTVNKTHGFLAS